MIFVIKNNKNKKTLFKFTKVVEKNKKHGIMGCNEYQKGV